MWTVLIVPSEGYSVSLDLGPVRKLDAPVQQIMVRTEQLTPSLIRVTVTGADFDRYRWVGPAARMWSTRCHNRPIRAGRAAFRPSN